jgi:uncharacterized BrkB/YihY/UPF0761 family membrane protein
VWRSASSFGSYRSGSSPPLSFPSGGSWTPTASNGPLAASASARLEEAIGRTALLGTALTLAIGTAIALSAMWLLPHRATDVRELLPGALLVTFSYQLVQIAVIFYFAPRLGRSEETYGAFGTAATTLVWLYVLSRLVVLPTDVVNAADRWPVAE